MNKETLKINIMRKENKHQVDEYFLSKLGDFEVQPSSEARQKFLSKLEEKEHKPAGIFVFKYFSMAASMLLFLGLGWWYFSGSSDVKPTELASVNIPTQKSAANQVPEVVNVDNEKYLKSSSLAETSVLVKETIEVSNVKILAPTSSKDKNTFGPNLAINENNNALAELKRYSHINVDDSIEFIENKSNSGNSDFTEQTYEEVQIAYEPRSIDDTYILISPIPAETPTFTELSRPPGEFDHYAAPDRIVFEQDVSLVAKVLKEVKQLKKGEKVDFSKLGFKPIEELALSEDGFLVSESRQIKQKLNWIKTKIINN
jgi:hypothetical protein